MGYRHGRSLFVSALSAYLVVTAFGAQRAEAAAHPRATFSATAPTATLGTIRQIRVDPANEKVYILGTSTSGLGTISADGSTYEDVIYSAPLPSHTGSDLAISSGSAFLSLHGSTNAVYRYDISGSTALLIASRTLSTGTSAIALGAGVGSVYVTKGTALNALNRSLEIVAPTTTLSTSAARLAYGGGSLFYLGTAGRFTRAEVGGSDTTIVLGGPTAVTSKSLAASDDGSALYYASTSGFGKISVADGSTLWTTSVSNLAGMDVSTSTGRVTIINTGGAVSTYDPIAPPSSVSASASGTSANLSWTSGIADEDFGGVSIRRSMSSFPSTVSDGEMVTSSALTTSLVDTGLADGTYYYSFFNETADGYFSSPATSTVTINLPPSAPTLEASTSESTILLTWNVPADTQSFVLRRSSVTYPTSHTDGLAVTSTNASVTSLTQNGMDDGPYFYSLFAADAEGNYSAAGTASVTIDTTAPASPTLTATASGTSITLSWDTPATTESFILRRSTTESPATISAGTAVTSTTATSFTQSDLMDSVFYYSVFALDSFGNASLAGTANATIDTTSPAAPSGVTATVAGSTITLSWTNPVDSDFASVIIRRSTLSYPSSHTDGSAVTSTSATSHSDTSLSDGTYYYSLFAQDATGNTSLRATASGVIQTSINTSPSTSSGGTTAFTVIAPTALQMTALGFAVRPLSTSTTPSVTHTPSIQLLLNADPATIRGYAVALEPTFTHASILPLPASGVAPFVLPDRFGAHTVYLRYFSLSGHPSAVFTQSMLFQAPVTATTTSLASLTLPRFLRSLRQGDRGNDVRALQIYLNRQGFLVAKSGPGSLGQETTFFGSATARAVSTFQEAHAKEILQPYALSKGTGIFGVLMRALINATLS